MLFKCKMCGGDLIVQEGSTVATCEYCGTVQTVPCLDNEKKALQFERAERLRRNCEFDKAAGVYETIVSEFHQEAEAYWGLVLCKYGIEYVDDPATGKKVPTCHRSSFESVMDDPNYEQTLENADSVARKVYREEAKAIEELRKSIIEVSSKETPYDIFICYKETDEKGQRTIDSVLAQDIYDALINKGYRVFFSRITLEDKLGWEFEPYIFAALNSAKVMLAIGTDYEYFNAVWVKNEWSRFLKLMEKDKSKHLIPCFKGIDAYDMPKEFGKLQAQDLGKVGAMQDLLRGIDKLLKSESKQQETVTGGTNIVDVTLKKAYDFLNEEDWTSAKKCLETILGYDPKNTQALIGCLMEKLHIPQEEKLAEGETILENETYYQQLMQFADNVTKARLAEYNRGSIYHYALAESKKSGGKAVSDALRNFERVSNYADAAAQIELLKTRQKKSRKARNRVIAAVVAVIVVAAATKGFLALKANYLDPLRIYKNAAALMEQGDYSSAADDFAQITNFKDSADQLGQCKLSYAQSLATAGDTEASDTAFEDYYNYINDGSWSNDVIYTAAQELFDAEQPALAQKLFDGLGDYQDAAQKASDARREAEYRSAVDHFQTATTTEEWKVAVSALGKLKDYKDVTQLYAEARFKLAASERADGNLTGAVRLLSELHNEGYEAAEDTYSEVAAELYAQAKQEYNAGHWGTARQQMQSLAVGNYEDSAALAENCDERIQEGRNKFNGIWRSPYSPHIMSDDLKIVMGDTGESTIYNSGGMSATGQEKWERSYYTAIQYDNDTETLSFCYVGMTYVASVNGNTMTITPTEDALALSFAGTYTRES